MWPACPQPSPCLHRPIEPPKLLSPWKQYRQFLIFFWVIRFSNTHSFQLHLPLLTMICRNKTERWVRTELQQPCRCTHRSTKKCYGAQHRTQPAKWKLWDNWISRMSPISPVVYVEKNKIISFEIISTDIINRSLKILWLFSIYWKYIIITLLICSWVLHSSFLNMWKKTWSCPRLLLM